ncbi:MAG: cyclic pyranopterin monophosphate synthase MoaC [Saprospiraceae bacterium]|nr:cyclic pyranopterin monophosphate synthase MoaC [Lewinellaceae bacterium]
MPEFTHLDAAGNPTMVDVGNKPVTRRTACAQAMVHLPPAVLAKLSGGEITVPKGAVFQTAILAGILAAKKTGDLIPLCHPLGLDNCKIEIRLTDQNLVRVECEAVCTGKTGVEMEALTGASIAALTIYDMCKSFSPEIIIQNICLLEKTGGKKDFKRV